MDWGHVENVDHWDTSKNMTTWPHELMQVDDCAQRVVQMLKGLREQDEVEIFFWKAHRMEVKLSTIIHGPGYFVWFQELKLGVSRCEERMARLCQVVLPRPGHEIEEAKDTWGVFADSRPVAECLRLVAVKINGLLKIGMIFENVCIV